MTTMKSQPALGALVLLSACGGHALPDELVGVFQVRVEQPGANLVVRVSADGFIREYYEVEGTNEYCSVEGPALYLDANARLTSFRVTSGAYLGETSGTMTQDDASAALRLHFEQRSVCPNTCAVDFEPITLDHTWRRIEDTPSAKTRCLQRKALWACPIAAKTGPALECDLPTAP